MANILYANNAAGTLASAITNTATSLTLNAGQATLFPALTPPQIFYATLTDAATQTLIEIVKVTAVSGNIFSIVRAQDGTPALSWNANDIVSLRTIRLELQGFENAAEGNFAAQAVAVTPSTTLGIVGTMIADNANAGSVGEYMAQVITSPVQILVSGSFFAIAQITLTPGDWDVSGFITFNVGASVVNYIQGTITPTINVNNAASYFVVGAPNSSQASTASNSPPLIRFNVNTNTQVFLCATAGFSGVGNMSAVGTIRARRIR
jgi:hypothetical protein